MKVIQNSSERRKLLINQFAMTDRLSYTSIFNSTAMEMTDGPQATVQSTQITCELKTEQIHP